LPSLTCDEGHCKELEEVLPSHLLKAAHTPSTLQNTTTTAATAAVSMGAQHMRHQR
jgi:hypothetical protein